MNNKYLLILLAILFSMPDTRFVGFTTQTLLLGSGILFSIVYFNGYIQKNILIFNSPFIYLLFLTIIIWLFNLLTYTSEDSNYIIARIRELFTDFLLIYLIYIAFINKTKFIKHFIELFFIFNIMYYFLKSINSSIVTFFHASILKEGGYVLENILSGREFFLGYEPSYIVPVSMILCLIYLTIYTNKLYAFLIIVSTIFIFFMALSKTAFILIFVMLFMKVYYYLNKKIINKNFIKFFIYFLFLIATIGVLIYLENEYHIFTFSSTNKSKQYELISFLTRSQLMIESINQFIQFPLGYGYGNSIIILSDYIDNNLKLFKTSFEIIESSRYARTPKSQLSEYILSGGFMFILLFIVYHIRYLNEQLSKIDLKTKQSFTIIITVLLISIAFGERIPYLLAINFLFMIAVEKTNQGKI